MKTTTKAPKVKAKVKAPKVIKAKAVENTYRNFDQARAWLKSCLEIDLALLGVTGLEIAAEIDQEKRGQQKATGYFRPRGIYDVPSDKWVPAVFLTAEFLTRPYWEVRGTVRHEAVHAANWWDGIQDTSNKGRFHNKHFKSRAISVGLDVGPRNGSHGYNITSLSALTLEMMKVEEPEDPNGVTDLAKVQNPKPEPKKKPKTLLKWELYCEHSEKVAYITPKENFDSNPCMHCGEAWVLIG